MDSQSHNELQLQRRLLQITGIRQRVQLQRTLIGPYLHLREVFAWVQNLKC